MNELGNYLRNKRKEKGWSIKEVASKMPVTSSTISAIERGEIKTPSKPVLNSFAKLYNVEVDTLTSYLEKTPRKNIARNSKSASTSSIL